MKVIAIYTLGKMGGRLNRELKNTNKKYILLVLRIRRFQNTPMKQDTFLFGIILTLLVMTLTGTHVVSNNPSTKNFILITSKEITKSKFPKHGRLLYFI